MKSELVMARETFQQTPESQRTQRARDGIAELEATLMDNGIDVAEDAFEEAPSEEELAAMEAELVAAKQRVAKLPPAKRTHRAMEGIATLERDLQVARDTAARFGFRGASPQRANLPAQGSQGPPASSMSPAAGPGASRGSESSWHEDA